MPKIKDFKTKTNSKRKPLESANKRKTKIDRNASAQ